MVLNEQQRTDSSPGAICERLKQVRIQVCGSRGQSHFATLLQLSPSTYNYYEKGRIPRVDVLDRAARITEAPLLWLIRGEPADFDLRSLRKIDAPARESVTRPGGGATPHGPGAAASNGVTGTPATTPAQPQHQS
jgi:DNA-binding XRE family transcriptional regulator